MPSLPPIRACTSHDSCPLHPPPCPPLQVVHFVADFSARRSGGHAAGCGHAGASTTNLLSHEDQRNSRPGADGGCGSGAQQAGAAPQPVASMRRHSATSAHSAPVGDVEAATDKGSGDGDSSSGGLSRAASLSAPAPLTEPCDALTGAIVAATTPEAVVASGSDGQPKPEVRLAGWLARWLAGWLARWLAGWLPHLPSRPPCPS
jgi:hypothetical protein